ncbi:MAG: glycosyltransferase family 4 protein [Conexivisphaerales archaeon]
MEDMISVIMLTWEYPPRIIGGLSAHVYELSKSLAEMGVKVHVVTCDFPGAPEYEEDDGVKVHRIDSYRYPTPDFATWVAMMNVNLQHAAAGIIASDKKFTLLHAHDWLVADASIGLKHTFRLPLVATIHSTEYGRRNGIHDDYQRMISSHESWLTREAWRVICCSNYMAWEVSNILGVSHDKIDVVPNGINSESYEKTPASQEIRSRFALTDEKLILYVGRLVHEKGVHLLLEAMPLLVRDFNAKLVVVGEGYLKEELINRARQLGIENKVYITGFLESSILKQLFRVADICVIPSLYEPFGIVALEAMVSRCPIVTTGVGGLGEILQHEKTALFVHSTPESIRWGISQLLQNRALADALAESAYKRAKSLYRWDNIARSTLSVYERVIKEYDAGSWKPK